MSFMNRYFENGDYAITIRKGMVHFINYLEIEDFSEERVIVKYSGGKSIVHGERLVMVKLMDDEVMIEGNIKYIEV